MTAFGERGFRRITSKSRKLFLKKVLTFGCVCDIIYSVKGQGKQRQIENVATSILCLEKFLKNFSKTP